MMKCSTRSTTNSRSKRRKSGVDSNWKKDFPWLIELENDEMKCDFSCRPQKIGVGKAVWVDLPCTTITRQSLVKHSKTLSHIKAVKMEADLSSAQTDGGITMAFQRVVSAQRKAFIGALKCMYFLNKREVAHTTNFVPLLELGKSLGASYLADIQVGGNAHYSSERFMQEIVECLGKAVFNPIVSKLRQSPFFALCIDETTDVSVTKELILYA